jgi:hypothetical protein
MRVLTSLDKWLVRLRSGSTVSIWADGFSSVGDEYVFSVLVEKREDEPGLEAVEIVSTTPADPLRVAIVVARIPAKEVGDIASA